MSASDAGSPRGPWERWSWAFACLWLVFLFYPATAIVASDAAPGLRVLAMAGLIGFATAYGLGFADRISPWLTYALLLLASAATIPAIGADALGFVTFLGVAAALLLPSPWWPYLTLAVAAVPALAVIADHEVGVFFVFLMWPVVGGMALMRVMDGGQQRTAAARAELALVAERERVARDVHDVLGHSLTVLSVKAELAGRLIDVDPERARAELASLQETARQALAEVRTTVGGLRAANLAAELATAPRVLADAGVDTVLEGDPEETDPRHRVLLAWVLREAVTNVVRHSGATRVAIRLGPTGLAVTDDGHGCHGAEGNGLRGMRERVAQAGGTLSVSDAHPGTRVEVVLG